MKVVGIIPARYKSSRFPGKPLCDICGKKMVERVYENCKEVKEFAEVYIATDDTRIYEFCTQKNINVKMTSSQHMTGTDRIAEVAEMIDADLYVNIQGDEPLLEPEVICQAILPFYKDKKLQVSNLMTAIKDPVDVVNNTVPKVITNKEGRGIYLTRAMAPYPKGKLDYTYYKQVCVYGFTKEALRFYADYGKEFGKAKIEQIEDIELLRFIENGYEVQFVEVQTTSVAVDTIKDLERVRSLVLEKQKQSEMEG